MKLQFKHQKFQADAAKAVVDVFAGQPKLTPSYMMDRGSGSYQYSLKDEQRFTGWSNHPIVPELTEDKILENLQKVQRGNQLAPSEQLEGKYNLTIEMETGVGKTYTYIKTMYELNKHYGWSKFIVVVPSIAIREGVYKSFEVTQEHFAEEYKEKIRFFIYNSAQLTEIDRFASDNHINVMIINSQAFAAKGKDARRIYAKLDEFRSRKPIDIIAKTNPILIIDEPQSVEGRETKKRLKEFNPLLTLRYSATHKADSIYNMVYRLDAMDAYNKQLVKKISVLGITEVGTELTEGFIFFHNVNLSKGAPTATITINRLGKNGVKKYTYIAREGDNLYSQSNGAQEYKDGFVISRISGVDNSIEFINGKKIYAGEAVGRVGEDAIRRIQIQETIREHIKRERQLYRKQIKVLSLFFIDEVANYRVYNEAGQAENGSYAEIFEEEYRNVLEELLEEGQGQDSYLEYLRSIDPAATHEGYFSIDKKGHMSNSEVKNKKEGTSDDISAYNLIMKDKERLLDLDPEHSPVRFIFSHSALREGWDNPNVFQICTLKQSGSEVRKRQEVGRGLRLCVNAEGVRMDANALPGAVHDVNQLTIIASESYQTFAEGLQTEMAEAVASRPKKVEEALFVGKTLVNAAGEETVIDDDLARKIYFNLVKHDYVDEDGQLTDVYYDAKKDNILDFGKYGNDSKPSIVGILDSVYNAGALTPDNARGNNVELKVDDNKLAMKEFRALWEQINGKTVYEVNFESSELVAKAVEALNAHLRVAPLYYKVERGHMERIASKDALAAGEAFNKDTQQTISSSKTAAGANVKYDLVGKLVDATGLTRQDVLGILTGIEKNVFEQFKDNPEEFILKAGKLINEQKATAIVEHITYNMLNESYDTDIFTEPTIKGRINENAYPTTKHLYNYVIVDSNSGVEKGFAMELDKDEDVAVYVKLPKGFYISTPVGHYNPDWAIAFKEGKKKHVYFVAETKGSLSTMDLRGIEKAKIECARKHFAALQTKDVVYDVVTDYRDLMDRVMK